MNTKRPPTYDMFLGHELDGAFRRIRETHSKYFDFAVQLNELAHRALFEAKVNRSDLQQLLLATLQHRALTSFQAVVILSERGLPSETRVVLRTLLEVTFRIVAIAKDKDVGRAYVLEDEVHRRKLIDKYKTLGEDVRNPASEIILEDLRSSIKQRIDQLDIKELKTHWFAKAAGMLDHYNTAYAVLSSSVHVSARNLEAALNLDASGQVNKIDYGPSDENVDMHLYTASDTLLIALHAVYSVIDTSFAAQLGASYREHKALQVPYE